MLSGNQAARLRYVRTWFICRYTFSIFVRNFLEADSKGVKLLEELRNNVVCVGASASIEVLKVNLCFHPLR